MSHIKKIICVLLAGILLVSYSCHKEEFLATDHVSEASFRIDHTYAKIKVCHKGRVISTSIEAVRAHGAHGDAIDMDGDGYFDKQNACSEIDCDDLDPSKNPGIPGSCDGGQTVSELLVGTWTTVDWDIQAFVGTQTLTDYLIDVLGLTPADAEDQNNLFVTSFEPEIIGALTLNADNTFSSDYLGGSDTGTWSLSPDEMTLTMFEGSDIIIVMINSISETTWDATLQDDFPVDLDGDAGTPDVIVTVIANVIAEK